MRIFNALVFSERKFSGYATWLGIFFLTAWAGVGVSLLGGRLGDGRLGAVTELILIEPLYRLCVAIVCVFMLARAIRQSVPAVLQAVMPWLLPLHLLPGCINIGWSVLPLPSIHPFFLNGAHIPLSLMTAGLAPYPLAPPGVMGTVFILICLLGREVLRQTKNLRKTIIWSTGTYLFLSVFLLFPSLLGWFGLGAQTTFLYAGSNAVARGLVVLSQEGYWWRRVVERFPGFLGGESEVSVALLVATLSYLFLVGAFCTLIRKGFGYSWRVWVYGARLWFLATLGSLLVLGGLFAVTQGSALPRQAVSILAMILLVTTWLAAAGAVLGAGDLADLEEDERTGRLNPLIQGEASPRHLADISCLLHGYALVGAWLLGWPIFVCVSLFLITQTIYRFSALRIKQIFPATSLVLGLSWLAAWLSGWFFVRQDALITRLALPLLGGLWIFFSTQTLLKSWSYNGAFVGPVVPLAIRSYFEDTRGRWIYVGSVAGGYLIPGIFMGSWFLFCFGGAIGLASLLVLLSNKPRILELRGLSVIFLVVMAFILSRS